MTKISELPAGTTPDGTEKFPVVQGGFTVYLTLSQMSASGAFTTITYSSTLTGTSTSSNALAVGRQGATNPVLNVDASTASVVTGLNIKGAAAAGGLALSVTSSGAIESLNIDAKGSGTITIGSVSTGVTNLYRSVFLGIPASLSGQLVFNSATSGNITINPPAGALGSAVWTLQAGTDTFVGRATTDALTNKTINGNTFTSGTYTLTGTASKTLTFNNTITLSGTDSTTMTFPTTTATIARTDASQTFSGTQTFAAGSAATPSVTIGTAGYGLYQPGVNQLGMALSGVVLFDYGITNASKFTFGAAFVGLNSILSTYALGGVGYATGAGSSATQATSKATTVAFNAVCGAITMNNAALAAATIVSFTFTNTAIAATDVLVLNHISGGTPGSYTLNARAAAGSATIDVRNNTAGSLSEAIVIQYAVIKAVIT